MKLTVFQSSMGDCLLLTGKDDKNMLADGGMAGSFSEHAAPTLGKLAEAGKPLDLVYVSHIDGDHISGILRLMDDIVDWRVYDYQQRSGNTGFREPSSPRPPEVKALWHNAFQDQVDKNPGELEEQLVLNMKTMLIDKDMTSQAEAFQNLINSEKQALLLSHRASPRQLGIPVNGPAEGGEGHLIYLHDEPISVPLGTMTLHIVGPFKEDLEDLRDEWNDWIKKNAKAIRDIRQEAEEEAQRQHLDEGQMLHMTLNALANQLGERNMVTTPNLASLMMLAEEDGKTILLTGDAHGDEIIKGLRLHGRINDQQGIHVDVLKVQHHGSEYNLNEEFCQWVTADHYVFCGNGAHHNPDVRVIQAIVDSRLGAAAANSKSPKVNEPFKLWFNSSERAANTSSRKKQMKEVKDLIKEEASKSQGKMDFHFLEVDSSFEITL